MGHIIVLMNRPLLESDAADVVGAAGETADVAEPDADPARPVGADSDTAARAGAEPVVTVLDGCLAATTSTKIATISTCTTPTDNPHSGIATRRDHVRPAITAGQRPRPNFWHPTAEPGSAVPQPSST